MVWLQNNTAAQQLAENVFLYDLVQIRGTDAILSRIPDNLCGIYAWYRRFELSAMARNDPEVFVTAILEEIYKPHCATRETHLPPSMRLIMQAETIFSKQQSLQELAQNSSFRELVCMLLENSLAFQQPLYIGKANNLKQRITNHLAQGSILRERLEIAKHDIDKCKLLIIGTASIDLDNDSSQELEIDDELNAESPNFEAERLIEDILSRLFLPSFSIQYG
ncbi:GIY-YIG nuclease family protein [Lusitaniella coriacea]|uniref:GIY-YIG nuclease family protein n=1 Tax=Lusitaniella coriacea TaxID=1983105 RepID=UPI003CEEDBE2